MSRATSPITVLETLVTADGPAQARSSAAMHVAARWWLLAFGLVHLGYALLGKGFAYLPYPPLFMGELLLASGAPLVLMSRRWRVLLSSPTVLLIMLLGAWCLSRTLPFVGTYGVDALRDSAIYYYGAFAIILAVVLMDQPELLPKLLRAFDRYGWWSVPLVLVLFLLQVKMGLGGPRWPVIGIPVLWLKVGDPLVILSAIASFTIVGLGRPRHLGWFVPMAALVAILGAISRGALIAFVIAFFFSLAFFPRSRWPWRVIAVSLVLLVTLVVIDPSIKVPQREREFSVRQFVLNIYSTFVNVDSGAGVGDLNETKTWRLEWWTKITHYTVGGEYFWGGKGFGINLANSDGFQTWEDESLRSPHNGNMTILARAGVPGAVIWAVLHLSWGVTVALGYLRARAHRWRAWQRYFIWVSAAYLATMFHASFDVYLENPMGGIWLWSCVGLGLAGAYLAPRYPALLEPCHTGGEASVLSRGSKEALV